MNVSPIVAQQVTCPVCEKVVNPNSFQFHVCTDGDHVITLDGQFHASTGCGFSARAYIYRTARRQEAAGMTVAIMPDVNDDYYGGTAPITEADLIEQGGAWADSADYDSALARLHGLAAEQAAHEDRVRDDVPVISLPMITRRAA